MSGAEELEIVTEERTYRLKCDDSADLASWLTKLLAASKL